MLVMEYMKHGSLHKLLRDPKFSPDGELVLSILRDITQGVRFLHSATPQVIHGDLKARNILVDSRYRAKVSDFGLSQKKHLGVTGTPFWMAPELLRGQVDNNTASDIFSFGIILVEVYSRQEPYHDEDFKDDVEVLKLVANPDVNKRPTVPLEMPDDARVLMTKCLRGDPTQRPSVEEVDRALKNTVPSLFQPILSDASSMSVDSAHRTKELLFEVFPSHIATRLLQGKKIEPKNRECVTVLCFEILDFPKLTAGMSPLEVSDIVDRFSKQYEYLCQSHGVFQVETTCHSYMVAANMIQDQKNHAAIVLRFATDLLVASENIWIDVTDEKKGCLRLRCGIHSGPAVATVIGLSYPRYCLFGQVADVARDIQENSKPNRILCSSVSATLARSQTPKPILYFGGVIEITNQGFVDTFWANEDCLEKIEESNEL